MTGAAEAEGRPTGHGDSMVGWVAAILRVSGVASQVQQVWAVCRGDLRRGGARVLQQRRRTTGGGDGQMQIDHATIPDFTYPWNCDTMKGRLVCTDLVVTRMRARTICVCE